MAGLQMQTGLVDGKVARKVAGDEAAVNRYKQALRERNVKQKDQTRGGGYGYQGQDQGNGGLAADDTLVGGAGNDFVFGGDDSKSSQILTNGDYSAASAVGSDYANLSLGQQDGQASVVTDSVHFDGGGGGGVAATRPSSMSPPGGVAGAPSTGLASLDVELPVRGTVYFFTTPRGKVEITARSVSTTFMTNGEYLLLILLVLAIAVAVYRVLRRERFLAENSSRLAAAAIVLGVASVVVGFLPVAGALIVLTGIVVRITLRRQRMAAVHAA
jgi:hypothetical protein